MATKTFYFTRTPIGGSGGAALTEAGSLPLGSQSIYTLLPTSADTVGHYAEVQGHFTSSVRPRNPIGNSIVFVSEIKYNGTFAPGDWILKATQSLPGLLAYVPSAMFQAHLVVTYWATPNLTANYPNARLLSPTTYSGTVATVAASSNGVSVVTAAMPQVQLNNEYLIVFMAWQLDTVVVGVAGPSSVQVIDGASSSLLTTQFTPVDPSVCILPSYKTREYYSYITPTGQEYQLDVPRSRVVISSEGEGLPPINYITQRGPFQDGVSLIDDYLQPRIVQLVIRHQYSNRVAYTQGRQKLVGTLDPLLQTSESLRNAGTLRKYHLDGSVRDLACLIIQGPNFNPRAQEWDEWAYNEVLRFQAFDPIYTEPTTRTQDFAGQGSELVGPMIGPITGTTLDSELTINYGGTWKAYPTITVTGPCAAVLVHNRATDEHLFINYPLPAGETIVITLVPGNKQVLLNGVTNIISYLSTDSDLATFHLTENNDGVNLLHAYASGVSTASLVSMSYQNRYLGI